MPGANREDVYKLLGYIQKDLSQTQAKLVHVRAMLAAGAMNNTERTAVLCPVCKVDKGTADALADHLELIHDQPRPR